MFWAPHHPKLRPQSLKTGGMTPSKPPTRRRHATRGLRMAQNPHYCPIGAISWLAGRGLTTHGSHALQTSSNWSILKRPSTAPVTNVVNLSQKTSIFNEKGVGLTTFVTTTQESTQKTPQIDDVCNKTRRATNQRPSPTGVEGAGGTGGHGWASRRGAERSEALASRAAGASGARNTIGATQQHYTGTNGERAGRRPRRSPARHANGWGASRHPTRHQHQSTNRSQPALTPSPAPPRG